MEPNIINEIWKQIKDYPNYEISNFGRVKSKCRFITRKGHGVFLKQEIILKPVCDKSGYVVVSLMGSFGLSKTRKVHQLVSESFLGHTPNGNILVVNHKNFIKTDNRVENLEIVTNRENSNLKHIPHSSIYTGVSWDKQKKMEGKNTY